MRVLIVGDVQSLANNFAKQGALVRLFKNAETFRTIVQETFTLVTDKPLVIGDLALVRGSGRLAKYLEEAMPEKIICLASKDCFDQVVLARITRKIKEPSVSQFSGKVDVRKAREALMKHPVDWDVILESDPFICPLAIEAAHSPHRKRIAGMIASN